MNENKRPHLVKSMDLVHMKGCACCGIVTLGFGPAQVSLSEEVFQSLLGEMQRFQSSFAKRRGNLMPFVESSSSIKCPN